MDHSHARRFDLLFVLGLLVAGLIVLDLYGGHGMRALRDLLLGVILMALAFTVRRGA